MIIKIDRNKRHEAGHDKLTGLCNPEHLMQKMKELPDKKKNRLIIYSDIAEFKLIMMTQCMKMLLNIRQ